MEHNHLISQFSAMYSVSAHKYHLQQHSTGKTVDSTAFM